MQSKINCFIMDVMKREVKLSSKTKTGRPRAFDEGAVLNKAMLMFWQHGYESTSMAVLSESMGMSPPSIYAAFGDKEALFLKSLDLYVGNLDQLRDFVNECSSAKEAVQVVLKASVIRFTGSYTPQGCMLASSTASCSAEAVHVQAVATKKRARIEEILRDRIDRDLKSGRLEKVTSASTLAALVITTIQGLSVLARDGVAREKLFDIAASAYQCLHGRAVRQTDFHSRKRDSESHIHVLEFFML